MHWRKTIYEITVGIEAMGTEREQDPVKNVAKATGCVRGKFKK